MLVRPSGDGDKTNAILILSVTELYCALSGEKNRRAHLHVWFTSDKKCAHAFTRMGIKPFQKTLKRHLTGVRNFWKINSQPLNRFCPKTGKRTYRFLYAKPFSALSEGSFWLTNIDSNSLSEGINFCPFYRSSHVTIFFGRSTLPLPKNIVTTFCAGSILQLAEKLLVLISRVNPSKISRPWNMEYQNPA